MQYTLIVQVELSSYHFFAAFENDYVPMPKEIRFGSCDMRMCVNVPTIDDEVVENAETFTVTLGIDSTLSRKIKLKSRTATIAIHDNDGV